MSTTEITREELRERIAALNDELAEAEREIGAATVEGKSATMPTKRAREAREGIRAAQVSLEELERRQARAEEEARAGEASKVRAASYESLAQHLDRMETYLRCRDAFEAAEKALLECPIDHKFQVARRGGRNISDEESDLDTGLVRAVPDIQNPEHRGKAADKAGASLRRMTPERARALGALAGRLAKEERSGNGVDRSQGYGTWNTEQRDRFERDLAAAAAPAHSG